MLQPTPMTMATLKTMMGLGMLELYLETQVQLLGLSGLPKVISTVAQLPPLT